MPTPTEFRAPFNCNDFYHVIFKSVDDIMLFREQRNKAFFLEKFSLFLQPVLNCWSYCLLDNHTHFITRIKDIEVLKQGLTNIPIELQTIGMKKFVSSGGDALLVNEVIERQINRFMVSYTNSYNKVFKRQGGLFQSPFRRALIKNDTHLENAIIYVHSNAQKHGLHHQFDKYEYSSYQAILSGSSSMIDVSEVLHFFGEETILS